MSEQYAKVSRSTLVALFGLLATGGAALAVQLTMGWSTLLGLLAHPATAVATAVSGGPLVATTFTAIGSFIFAFGLGLRIYEGLLKVQWLKDKIPSEKHRKTFSGIVATLLAAPVAFAGLTLVLSATATALSALVMPMLMLTAAYTVVFSLTEVLSAYVAWKELGSQTVADAASSMDASTSSSPALSRDQKAALGLRVLTSLALMGIVMAMLVHPASLGTLLIAGLTVAALHMVLRNVKQPPKHLGGADGKGAATSEKTTDANLFDKKPDDTNGLGTENGLSADGTGAGLEDAAELAGGASQPAEATPDATSTPKPVVPAENPTESALGSSGEAEASIEKKPANPLNQEEQQKLAAEAAEAARAAAEAATKRHADQNTSAEAAATPEKPPVNLSAAESPAATGRGIGPLGAAVAAAAAGKQRSGNEPEQDRSQVGAPDGAAAATEESGTEASSTHGDPKNAAPAPSAARPVPANRISPKPPLKNPENTGSNQSQSSTADPRLMSEPNGSNSDGKRGRRRNRGGRGAKQSSRRDSSGSPQTKTAAAPSNSHNTASV